MGARYLDIRIPDGIPAVLAPESYRDLQAVCAPFYKPETVHANPALRIVEKPVLFPAEPPISAEAQDIIRSFCTVDRSRRLGNISGGAARVKEHPFFAGINWTDIYNRTTQGPIIPPVRWPGDAQCFDIYPEDDGNRDQYTTDMAERFDGFFADF